VHSGVAETAHQERIVEWKVRLTDLFGLFLFSHDEGIDWYGGMNVRMGMSMGIGEQSGGQEGREEKCVEVESSRVPAGRGRGRARDCCSNCVVCSVHLLGQRSEPLRLCGSRSFLAVTAIIGHPNTFKGSWAGLASPQAPKLQVAVAVAGLGWAGQVRDNQRASTFN